MRADKSLARARSAASISAGVVTGRAMRRSRWSMRRRMMRRRAALALAFNLGFSSCARGDGEGGQQN